MAKKGWKNKKTPIIVGTETAPTKMESGQVIINKKATKQNLNKLIEINNDGLDSEKSKVSTDGTDGGILKGKPHYDKNGNSLGGIPVIVDGGKKIEVEGEEFVINKEASQKHWKELSKINQSAGNGVPINPSDVGSDEDPQEFRKGGTAKIIFNPNHIPNKWIYSYAKKIKENYPKVWDMGGNIFGNEAFKNLERVVKRGYWTDNEEWMYIKWQSFVARHHKDFRIAGTVAMLKWLDKTDKGWNYMKDLIDKEVAKKYAKKGFKRKLLDGGGVGKIMPQQGTLLTKDKKLKLDYKKNGNNFEFVVYDGKTNPVVNYTKTSFKKKENGIVTMDYNQFINYIYSEGYIDDKNYALGGGVKDISCKSCNWSWNKSDSKKHDEYVCHKCGTDNEMKNGGTTNDFDWESLFNPSPEEQERIKQEIKKSEEQEKEDWYQGTKFSKKWAATYQDAINRTVKDYLDAKATYDDWASRQYKSNKGVVFLGGDDIFGEAKSIGSINEGRRKRVLRGAKMQMDESIETLKELRLTDEEISNLLNNKMKNGGELAKGIKAEKEHIDTAKKLYNQKITPNEAARSIAMEHIKEDPKYYSKMETIDFDKHYDEIKTKYADGGNLEPTYTLNTPSGDKSRLTYLQQVLVRTSTFKNFFGDWETAAKNYLADNRENYKQHFENVSKVMDMSILEPRVVYHGTKTEKEFFMFDVSKEKGQGRPYAYFAHNIEYSKNFTNFSQRGHSNSQALLYECFLNVRNPFRALGQSYETKRKEYDYWLTTIIGTIALDKYDTIEKNTKTKNLESAVNSQIEKYLKDSATDTSVPFWYYMARDTNSEFKYFLLAYGYDGIFYGEEYATDYDVTNPKEYTNAVCIFTANDIKLADGRNLNFDPMNADIRYEKGGVPEQKAPTEHTLNKKEALGNLLFGEKYAKGGATSKSNEDANPMFEKEPDNNRKFVDELIKKMKK
jgi:hypothetical protein